VLSGRPKGGAGHSEVLWRRRAGLRGCPAPCAILHAYVPPPSLPLPPVPHDSPHRRALCARCFILSLMLLLHDLFEVDSFFAYLPTDAPCGRHRGLLRLA